MYDPASGMSTYIINNNLHGGSMVSWIGLSYLCDMMLTVVECAWAFDMIMLGATVLGAGIILFTAGPLGIPLALAVSAIGIGAIAAGGLYLKNIGDRFSDATMLMDDYMNGDASAGEKLKTHSLFHGTVMGGGIVVGKALGVGVSKALQAWSRPNVAPFFKVWVMDKVDSVVFRVFERIPGGVDSIISTLENISPKYVDLLTEIIIKYGESAVPDIIEITTSTTEKAIEENIDILYEASNKLQYNTNGTWSSKEGIIYGQGSKQGNRILHILEHMKPNPLKPTHTVFSVSKDEIISLIDEGWTKKGNGILQGNGNKIYEINMGRIIGTNGEDTLIIITKGSSNEIVTAYPKGK